MRARQKLRTHFNPRSSHRERRIRTTSIISLRISIHAPLTGSDVYDCSILTKNISIHAPLTGSDEFSHLLQIIRTLFQSTLPSQGATKITTLQGEDVQISIHAPLTGSDVIQSCRLFNSRISIHAPLTGSDANELVEQIMEQNFNPRSPHRERL